MGVGEHPQVAAHQDEGNECHASGDNAEAGCDITDKLRQTAKPRRRNGTGRNPSPHAIKGPVKANFR